MNNDNTTTKVMPMNRDTIAKAGEVAAFIKPFLSNLAMVQPRLDELATLNNRFIGFDSLYQQALADLQDIRLSLQSACADDTQQAESRGMKQLVGLCARRLLAIKPEIASITREFEIARSRYEEKRKTLTEEGFSEAQINMILPVIDKTAHREAIARLQRESDALVTFTRDFPRFDQSVLVGTAFEHWKPEPSESDFETAAKALAA